MPLRWSLSTPCAASERRRRPGGQAGFTLVEILVALTLLGLVVAILAGGLRLGIRVWEVEGPRAERLSETQAVQAFLRRLIQQAYPIHAAADGSIAFDGRSGSLAFVAPLPSYVGYGGYHRVEIALEGSGRNRQLVFRHVLLHPDVDPRHADPSLRGETVLLQGVQRLEISYFGSGGAGGDGTWRKEWSGQDRLPDLVRVAVRLGRDDAEAWPPLVAAPMVGRELMCVREPNNPRCRRPAAAD